MKFLNKNINAVINTTIPVIVIVVFLKMFNIISEDIMQKVFLYVLGSAIVISLMLITREFVIKK